MEKIKEKPYERIHGWLAFFAFGLYAGTIILTYNVLTSFTILPFWITIGYVVLILIQIVTIYLMHTRNKFFIVSGIITLVCYPIFFGVIAGSLRSLQLWKDVFYSCIGAWIWIGYLFKSKRVAKTFGYNYKKSNDEK